MPKPLVALCLVVAMLALNQCSAGAMGSLALQPTAGTATFATATTQRPAAPATAAAPTMPPTPIVLSTAAAPTQAPTLTALPLLATPAPAPDLFLVAQAPALLPEAAGDLPQQAAWDRYTINVALDPDSQTISGSMQVTVTNNAAEPFDALYFHLYPNHPDFGGSASVNAAQVNDVPTTASTANGDTLLRVDLAQPLPPGAQATVVLDFTVRTPRNNSGRTFGAFNQEAGVWAIASFYPMLARYTSGSGWDRRPIDSRGDYTVSDVALYDVTVTTPPNWALVTTGVRTEQQPQADGNRSERFVSGPQREFFLAALQGLEQASSTVEGTRITAYYQAGNPAAGQRSLLAAEDAVRIFNQKYGRYPLAELDVIQAALTRFLGMEYPSVVLIEQQLYSGNRRSLETTVAHEVAHQWWYSQVGNDAQGNPWLDEGLASFSQVVFYESRGDAAEAERQLDSFRNAYQSLRSNGRDAAIDQPPSALGGAYVSLVYSKSALFFQALREQLGDATFEQFIQNYYATYRYGEASGAGLLNVAQTTCGCDLQQFYTDWVTTAAPVTVP